MRVFPVTFALPVCVYCLVHSRLLLVSLGLLLAGPNAFCQTLPGFTLAGENWTYDPGDGGAVITGILSQPATTGSLPAVLISHGKGGTASGFSLPKAHLMTNWGVVGIGPDYTHAGSGSIPEQEGYSPENSRRARACLSILRNLSGVDTNRLAAYGNSMGAFLTAGLCGELTNVFRAAAITAGGTSGSTQTNVASPAVQEVQGIRAPFLMLHGSADTTVRPEQSALLQAILASNGVPNKRVLFDGVGHGLVNERSDEVFGLIKDWFTQWGVLASNAAPSASAAGRPRGLYVLDSPSSTTNINGVPMRDGNIRTNDFVTGYVLRASWSTLEPARDQFEFTIIDWNVRRLAALGQKLSLLLLNTEPAWLAQTPDLTTWYDSSLGRDRPVPWDPFLLTRLECLLQALASHPIDGVPLKDHPVLEVANFGLVGAKLAIRDPDSVRFRDMPGYSRAALTDAVQRNLRAATTNFPAKFIQIGFWPVTDYTASPSLWEELRQAILAEFNGVTRPRVGFWMENLSASRPAPGQEPVSGKPVPSFGAPLHLSQTNTWVGFQALTSWRQPFNNYENAVTNATPGDGLAYAFGTYGSTYCELYAPDIDYPGYRDELAQWHQRMTTPAPRLVAVPAAPGALALQWDRAAAVTEIQTATNGAGPFSAGASLTNGFGWTNHLSGASAFFRLRQAD
jgi:dienelactone hydrolase